MLCFQSDEWWSQRRSSAAPSKKRRIGGGGRQSKLDFGQKRTEECSVCGLVYELGNLKEASTHRKECDAYVFGTRHRVLLESKGVKYVVTKDEETLKKVNRLADAELGCRTAAKETTAYLALSEERLVVGCALVVSRDGGIGIEKLWVRDKWRRRRVAWTLLEQVRRHSAFQYKIPKRKIAFTQPTTLGRHFMTAYLGEKCPLIIY